MFSNISMAGTGLAGVIVYVIILVGKILGIDIAEAELTTHVQNVIGAVGFVLVLIGQVRRPDLIRGLLRRKQQ